MEIPVPLPQRFLMNGPEFSSTTQMEHGIGGVNPHSGKCLWFIFHKWGVLRQTLTVIGIFGSDEGLDGLTEVTTQPIRHVFLAV